LVFVLKDLAETFLYDHTVATVYISTLQNILLTYNPSLSVETGKILSKAGMVKLTADDMKNQY